MSNDRMEVIWGKRILDNGWLNVPNMIVRCYRHLGIEHGEFGFIMNILTYKHDSRDPYPSRQTLAGNMKCSTKQISKWSESLLSKGLIKIGQRIDNDGTFGNNVYNFEPLIEACLQLLEEEHGPEEVDQENIRWRSKGKEKETVSTSGTNGEGSSGSHGLDSEVPTDRNLRFSLKRKDKNNQIKKKTENKNLSINEVDIEALDVPISIKKAMLKRIDRLNSDNIALFKIEEHYHANKERVSEGQYVEAFSYSLDQTPGVIRNIKGRLTNAVQKVLEFQTATIEKPSVPATRGRKELEPEWLAEQKRQTSQQKEAVEKVLSQEEAEAERERLAKELAKYKKSTSKNTSEG